MNKKEQIELVKKAKKGDEKAFVTLCENYQKVLYNLAFKILHNADDAGDCIQETELKAWINIKSLRKETTFNTWLYKIMYNVINDFISKRKNLVELKAHHLVTLHDSEKRSFGIDELMDELPYIYKIILVMYYYAGLSIKEISKQQGINTSTVKTRMSRGKKILKEKMEGGDDIQRDKRIS